MENIKLADLINIEALQRIQDGFSKYTGMAAITTDVDGQPITKESGFTRFCNGLTRQSELGCKECEKCDKEGSFRTLEDGKATAYVCHAGLMDFAAPIMVEGRVIGGFIGGQVRIKDVDEDDMRDKAIKYGIDPNEYISAAYETSLLTREDVEKAAHFLEELAAALSLMAYKSYLELKESELRGRVAQSQADYMMNMSMNLEHVVERWLRIVDNSINKTSDSDIAKLLLSMQDDGAEVRNSVRDTISFIKMSANDVEISEAEYSLTQLVDMISDFHNGNISISVAENDDRKLFGDVVRIGQMINKIIKLISGDGRDNNLEILLSKKRSHYATNLNIEIIGKDTDYSEQEIERISSNFQVDVNDRLDSNDDMEMGIYLEGMLLKNMSGTIDIGKKGEDFVMKISIPQIGL